MKEEGGEGEAFQLDLYLLMTGQRGLRYSSHFSRSLQLELFEDEPVRSDSNSCDDLGFQVCNMYYRGMHYRLFDLTLEKQQWHSVDSEPEILGF